MTKKDGRVSRPNPDHGSRLTVMAYWRNDLPAGRGLGVGLEFVDLAEGEAFCLWLEQRLLDFDRIEAAPAHVESTLAMIASDDATPEGRLDDEGTRRAMSGIYWLEARGHLERDEYNGMLWWWTEGGITIAVDVNPYGPRGVVATGPTTVVRLVRGAKPN